MQTFVRFGDSDVRAFALDGEPHPWLALTDVCSCLAIPRTSDAVAQVPPDQQKTITIQKAGPGTNRLIVIEPIAAFRLVFRCSTPQAKEMADSLYMGLRKNLLFPDLQPTPPQPTLPPEQTHIILRGQPIRLYAFEHEAFLWLSWQDVLRVLNIGEISIASMRIPSHQHKITAFGTRSKWVYDPNEECGVDPQFVARMIKGGSTAEAFEVRKELGEECYPAMRGSAAVRIAMALAVKNPYFTPRRLFPTTTKASLEAPLNQSGPPQLPNHSIPRLRITAAT